jgi:hypothetical protein
MTSILHKKQSGSRLMMKISTPFHKLRSKQALWKIKALANEPWPLIFKKVDSKQENSCLEAEASRECLKIKIKKLIPKISWTDPKWELQDRFKYSTPFKKIYLIRLKLHWERKRKILILTPSPPKLAPQFVEILSLRCNFRRWSTMLMKKKKVNEYG